MKIKPYPLLQPLCHRAPWCVALSVLLLSACARPAPGTRLQEITVERINIVDEDGKVQMVISNKERAPDPIVGGKVFPRQGGDRPGIIFYNGKGDESGGLIFGSEESDGEYSAGAALLFDQYNQDQAVGIIYSEENGSRYAGFRVWDRPDTSILELMELLKEFEQMKEGPEKEEAKKKLREAEARGDFGAMRLFVGKNRDKAAVIQLSDPQGKPRIRIMVDAKGNPSLDFLDDSGNVTFSLPGSLAAEPGAPEPR